jgi:hypothetical protein
MRLTVAGAVLGAAVAGVSFSAGAAHAQVTVSGVGYVFYGYALKPDSGLVATTGSAGHDNNFDVARSYINVQTKSGTIATRVTADVDGRKAATNQLSFRLKYAYVAWTPEKSALTYKIGLIHTPWVDWEENLWDYRMQGATAVDRNGLLTSSDLGAGIDGSWHFDDVNAQVGVYDGEGYSNAPGDDGKDIEGRVSVRVLKSNLGTKSSGLRISGYAQQGTATGGGARQRFIGELSYKSKEVTLGAQIAAGQDSINATHPKQKSQITSFYGVFNIPKTKAALIARIDTYDPNTDSTSAAKSAIGANKQTRFIGGIAYNIAPNFRVLADLDLNSLENSSVNAFDKSRQMVYFHTQFTF